MSKLSGLTPPTKEPKCRVVTVAESLSKEEKEIVLAAVMNLDWSINGLGKALRSRGVILSREVLERHRQKRCACNA